MAASREDVNRWVKTAKDEGYRYIISVCDTFEWEDYPVYIKEGENLEEAKLKYDGVNMQKINEVIDLNKLE